MSDSYETDSSADAPTLWPAPSACNANDGEGAATWLARRERLKLKGYNGNGAGIPLAIAVQVPEALVPAPSTPSSAARLASRLRRLVSALAIGTAAGSGMRHCASLATSAQSGPYWSNPQVSLAFDIPEGSRPLDEYSGSWPRSAIVSATTRGAPVLWARRTDATGSSSWGEGKTEREPKQIQLPNGRAFAVDPEDYPAVSLHRWTQSTNGYVFRWLSRTERTGKRRSQTLHTQAVTQAEMWSTPNARDYKGQPGPGWSEQSSLPRDVGAAVGSGQLSPDWVETLMALPVGWTDPDCAEPQDWPGWPARPGQPQHAYESPRLASSVKHRVSRLKALGNAVVAAQALPLFQAIMQVERAECEDGDADV